MLSTIAVLLPPDSFQAYHLLMAFFDIYIYIAWFGVSRFSFETAFLKFEFRRNP
jgi:hypothetical protein